ncbi:MAG: putative quinol monooxygenase [Candidatus Marinarcus sp.]|uniref:putative quinol monooxygenase n=1 Tax=Candidatus Marinarcus sp. TaxID=3100987 RepID=UPI003B00F48C
MSKKIYCVAGFKAKKGKEEALFKVLQNLEPQTQREDGCIQYLVTKHISHPNATGDSLPIVFNEIWRDKAAFELHCAKEYITDFFQTHCLNKDGLVEEYNVCVYSDE